MFKVFYTCAMVALALTTHSLSFAETFAAPYALPELLHQDDLKQVVYIPSSTNLNTAPLAELLNLPGVDMNTALKLMQVRPVRSADDMKRKMPTITPSVIQQLMQHMDPKILLQ